MIDTLIAFGCSHTQGDEAVIDYNVDFDRSQNIFYSYPYFLSKMLNCEHYYNYAVCGSSNQQIASSFFENIEKHIDKINEGKVFILIGWTCYNRIRTSQYTEKSFTSLRGIVNTIPVIKRILFIKNFFKKNIPKAPGEQITISKGIIRLIARLKHNINIESATRKYRNINEQWYKQKVKPHYSDEFILGIDKHIFHTDANRDTNIFIKLCVDLYLTNKKIPYIALPTMQCESNIKDKLFNYVNNVDPKTFLPSNLSFIHYYGEKYGMSTGGGHMKAQAHKHFANFLYEEILQRKIISL